MSRRRLTVAPPLRITAALQRSRTPLPFPLDQDGCELFPDVRQAFAHALAGAGVDAGQTLLVPCWGAGTAIEAAAAAGIAWRPYALLPSLAPDPDAVARELDRPTHAFLLVHALGVPQDAPRWRGWCDQHDLVLIEDATQAWPASREGRPAGSSGEAAVFDFRAVTGAPRAAAALVPGAAERARRPPWHIRWLLPRLATDEVRWRRRANHRFLLDALGEQVPESWRDIPAGASPFVLPLPDAAGDLAARLRQGRIEPLELAASPVAADARAAEGTGSLAGLPVHQELGRADLDRLVAAAAPRRPGANLLRPETLDGFDTDADAWTTLAERVPNIFATWEWCSTWWRHFGEGPQPRMPALRDPRGGLAAVLPLYRTTLGPLRVLRFVGHGPGDQLGPICSQEHRLQAAGLLEATLRDSFAWDVLLGEQLPAGDAWGAYLGARVLRREANPVLALEGTWDDYLARRGRHFRKKLGWQERKLAREFDLRYRLCDDPERLPADLDTFFDLHARRWSGAGSQALSPQRRAFHGEFARLALGRGWLRLWLMELDGRPAAGWYGFRFGGAEWHYQSGRNPSLDRWSIGITLLVHTLREAVADGLAEYRFLRGDEPYKDRFAGEDAGLETLVLGRGVAGRAALLGARAALGLPKGVRRRARAAIPALR